MNGEESSDEIQPVVADEELIRHVILPIVRRYVQAGQPLESGTIRVLSVEVEEARETGQCPKFNGEINRLELNSEGEEESSSEEEDEDEDENEEKEKVEEGAFVGTTAVEEFEFWCNQGSRERV